MNSRPGFSFTEILFAVIILGIGFIMVAAIFPVAIQQGKVTTEEGAAASVAREALNYLGQVGANSDSIPNAQGGPLFPATGSNTGIAPYLGNVYSFRDTAGAGSFLNNNIIPTADTLISGSVAGRTTDELWNRLNLSLVVPSDQRFAFVGMYRRNGNPNDRRTWSPFVQAWFIPTTVRSRSVYNPGTLTAPGTDLSANPSNLQSRLVKVSIDIDPIGTYSATSPGAYVLYNWTGASVAPTPQYTSSALFENCYVIIANDEIPTTANETINGVTVPNTGRMNGHIYHVGLRRPDLDNPQPGQPIPSGGSIIAYDLNPNGTFTPDTGADGYFGTASTPDPDDILTIGVTSGGGAPAAGVPFTGTSSAGNASGPADAYVIGVDNTPGVDPGQSQDISAFTTFIKVN